MGYSSRGGENWTKTGIRLVCKTVFAQLFPSGGRPMLLIRLRTDKKMSLVNRNVFEEKL